MSDSGPTSEPQGTSLAGPTPDVGVGADYYADVREDMVPFLPQRYSRVLEVGCGEGAFSTSVRGSSEYWGVEPNPVCADRAAARLHQVFTGQYEQVASRLPDAYFDLVVCNDVIEHMADPEAFLASVRTKMAPGGYILVSLPNMRHWELLFELLVKKDWRYRQSGGLDRTHLRWFTRKSLARLLEGAGFTIEQMNGINPPRSPVRRAVFHIAALLSAGYFDDLAYPQLALRAKLVTP